MAAVPAIFMMSFALRLPSDSRHFGHLAYLVDDIYATCQHLMDNGVTINRPPRDGHMAFVRSPDGPTRCSRS